MEGFLAIAHPSRVVVLILIKKKLLQVSAEVWLKILSWGLRLFRIVIKPFYWPVFMGQRFLRALDKKVRS